ncbi:uncharacterized protein BJ212DRAFT_1396005 [Suillus subaureus]|uniref:Uncharacterized protein n=1 Tax=Suillus subaureus TaxID=48587 RepID=A0A9P7J5A3_9AGAM|nr:uncharacterized protein BJ212DRAFT_1396005 [Suillus subaureus]KAG1803407.1 hypothetical protein BJ212DRAFT_1396005 [Suillus subaureus]
MSGMSSLAAKLPATSFYAKGEFLEVSCLFRARLRAALDEYSSDERTLLHFPPLELCTSQHFNMPIDSQGLKFDTDNAVMIEWASMHRFLAGDYDDYLVDLCIKWSIEDIRV